MNRDLLVPIADHQGPRGAANGRVPTPPWRQWFERWDEGATAAFEQLLRNPSLLELGGSALTTMMRLLSLSQRTRDAWWAAWGLPTRRDQERLLHELQQLHSRLFDLEEQLAARGQEQRDAG